jgi:thioesterase domain-containing protein
MPGALDRTAGARLQAYLHAHIPLVHHMQVQVESWTLAGLTLCAPLAANINHEGTAFGGSLESLAMLACWGMAWLLLEHEPAVHIVVAESRMRFLQPVTDTLHAYCPMLAEAVQQTFLDTLHRRHKVRIELHASLIQGDGVCAEFTGQFAAWREKPHAAG